MSTNVNEYFDRGRRHVLAHEPPRPDPDVPYDPDQEEDLPDVNPGGNPDNPGDNPGVAEPGKPAKVIAFRR